MCTVASIWPFFFLHLSLSMCRDVQPRKEMSRCGANFPSHVSNAWPIICHEREPWEMLSFTWLLSFSSEFLIHFSYFHVFPKLSIIRSISVDCWTWMSLLFDRYGLADLVLCRQILRRRSVQTRRGTHQVSPPTLFYFLTTIVYSIRLCSSSKRSLFWSTRPDASPA